MTADAPAPVPEATLASLVAAAHAAADAARPIALRWFRAPALGVDDKAAPGGFDPVTIADRDAEAAMRATLARLRPDDGVIGEEIAAKPGTSGFTWVLDPIDGTRAFIAGAPTWGMLIAVNDGVRPIVGLIDQPFTGERFEGVVVGASRGARWTRGAESRALKTRPCARLEDATLLSTYPEVGDATEAAAFNAVRRRARLTRFGLDCTGYALVALGCADLVIEAGLQPYDVQAVIPVVEGAGGVITGWKGEPCAQGGRVVAAGDPRVHAAALEMLARA